MDDLNIKEFILEGMEWIRSELDKSLSTLLTNAIPFILAIVIVITTPLWIIPYCIYKRFRK